jgi:hypothetical protein
MVNASSSTATPPQSLEQPGASLTGPLAKVQLSRPLSPSAKGIFTGGQDFTDASSSFSSQSVGATGIGTTTPAALTSDTYRVTYASAGWQYIRNRTTLGVTARWEKDIYPGLSALDVTRPSAEFNIKAAPHACLDGAIGGHLVQDRLFARDTHRTDER